MIRLQIQFTVEPEAYVAFERMYRDVYLPALRRQPGYRRSSLLRTYGPAQLAAMDLPQVSHAYEMELEFDTEENRQRWAASPDHEHAWGKATALASGIQACGYHVLADSDAPHLPEAPTPSDSPDSAEPSR